MNYRITNDFNAPFKIYPFFETETPYKVILKINVTVYIYTVKIDVP